ncbi:MAG TPA: long-chain fatty acid--CoA ligase [Candidatus Binatia bacterium]
MTSFDNLAAMFFAQERRYADRPRYRYKRDGVWQEVNWATCADRVRAMACGLVSLGLEPGERVALLSKTRPEWIEFDLAVLASGGITVPIYPSNLPDECGYIIWDSGTTIACVESSQQLAKVRQVQQQGFELDGRPYRIDLRQMITIDETGDPGAISLRQLMERGRSVPASVLHERINRIGRDQLATIVYTSGTTGPPKGVMQSHGNHLAAVESVGELRLVTPGDIDFFFLPLAHSFARLIEYLGLSEAMVTAFAQSIDTLMEDIHEVRPQLIPSVPRIYEKVFGRIQAGREASPAPKRLLLDWAFAVGRRRSERLQSGGTLSPGLALQAALADRLVFSKIQGVLGGRTKFMISGGAPLAPEIAEFFHASGLLILEGYGLTETTPILTVNQPDKFKFGTVGLPLSCVTLKIAADGEILAKGPNIALGYYNRPDATREAWDEEGWFHTGDIGEIDAEGFLRITDRKKDLIKTSGGKYVAPQNVENLLKTQPHISQAVVIGDRRKYCVTVLTLDHDEVQAWAAREHIHLPADRSQWADDARVRALIDAEVAEVNRRLASYESLKYHRILPRDFSVETGELTPSLKVKRKVIAERYRDLIEDMY